MVPPLDRGGTVAKWIQLIQHWRFPEEGYSNRGRLYYPGHVRQVSDDLADTLCLTMVQNRPVARCLEYNRDAAEKRTAGVIMSGAKKDAPWAESLEIEIAQGPPEMAWDDNLLWDTSAALRIEMIPIGYNLLATWDIAVPLMPEQVLAADLGTPEERAMTEEVIHDLRVPVYDTRVLFVRRNRTTERLMGLWYEERMTGEPLAFLRALGQAQPKPLLCALPAEWVMRDE